MLFSLLFAAAPLGLATPPEGFVELRDAVPAIALDMRYGTADNFTGAPLPGYGAPGAWLLAPVAAALARVQATLQTNGLGLLVYDAYRPQRATQAMVAWAERTGQMHLFDTGYIARRSGHNHGHTVDLTLVDKDGVPLDMGTPWDTLNDRSHTKNASGLALSHRMSLKAAMEGEGFKGYYKEWWHFSFPLAGTRARDVPYGCFEPPEGQFHPPKGWNAPGFAMPQKIPARACR